MSIHLREEEQNHIFSSSSSRSMASVIFFFKLLFHHNGNTHLSNLWICSSLLTSCLLLRSSRNELRIFWSFWIMNSIFWMLSKHKKVMNLNHQSNTDLGRKNLNWMTLASNWNKNTDRAQKRHFIRKANLEHRSATRMVKVYHSGEKRKKQQKTR